MTVPDNAGRVLPVLRADIQISVHNEEDENYLVLHDTFGVAEGPIMIHVDMLDVLQACDGVTTISQLALAAGVDESGPEITRLTVFLGQMDTMGYLEGEAFAQRQAQAKVEWENLDERAAVCAGAVYPTDPDELRQFLSNTLGIKPRTEMQRDADVGIVPYVALIPHIDFRVAPHMYGPGFNALVNHPANVVIMVGTSHYWSDDAFVLTEKSYTTPLGTVQTDVDLVRRLAAVLPGVSGTDLAHKPEHSLELHIVCLQHLWPGKPFRVVPLLVTSAALDADVLQRAAEALRATVSGNILWLISGDLAHIGKKFGDVVPASSMLEAVKGADHRLLEHLRKAAPERYNAEILSTNHAYRICGHAPTLLALTAAQPSAGTVVAYDIWEEEGTESAVSFATVLWQ